MNNSIARYKVLLNENEGWQKFIGIQCREVPELEKLLDEMPVEDTRRNIEEVSKSKHFFQTSFSAQQSEMELINTELSEQQKRLLTDCELNDAPVYDIDTVCKQDILREKIKELERKYLELKCNFMTYLSSVLQ